MTAWRRVGPAGTIRCRALRFQRRARSPRSASPTVTLDRRTGDQATQVSVVGASIGHRNEVDTARVDDVVTARWWILRQSGTTAVLCATNETARRLNARMQAIRLATGELAGPALRLPSGEHLYVGDVVATRRTVRTVRTDRGAMVKNRATWTITGIDRNGSVTVTGTDRTITLRHDYVARYVELAYAETIHAAQGHTVDHALLVVDGPIDGPIDGHGIYVGMTRGRHSNDALVVTEPGATARDTLADALSRSWLDRPPRDRTRPRPPRPHRTPRPPAESPDSEPRHPRAQPLDVCRISARRRFGTKRPYRRWGAWTVARRRGLPENHKNGS